jgi:hypothetical protein
VSDERNAREMRAAETDETHGVPCDRRWTNALDRFLTDVLALEGEDPDAIRKGVRVALADCEAIFRTHRMNVRMRGCAALASSRRYSNARERGRRVLRTMSQALGSNFGS